MLVQLGKIYSTGTANDGTAAAVKDHQRPDNKNLMTSMRRLISRTSHSKRRKVVQKCAPLATDLIAVGEEASALADEIDDDASNLIQAT